MNSHKREIITLKRDTVAMMVPSGARIMLHEGTEVTITQAFGDSFTVHVFGNLARIDGKDGDALGRELKNPLKDLPDSLQPEERVMAILKTVYDPEIPVNIVDLGLIYVCSVQLNSKSFYTVSIEMTLTAPGCGMGPVIVSNATDKIKSLPEVDQVNVELVFDPPWNRSMMSELAKFELGMF